MERDLSRAYAALKEVDDMKERGEMPRFCDDCKWAGSGMPGYSPSCNHPVARVLSRACKGGRQSDMRFHDGSCGKRGDLWEPSFWARLWGSVRFD